MKRLLLFLVLIVVACAPPPNYVMEPAPVLEPADIAVLECQEYQVSERPGAWITYTLLRCEMNRSEVCYLKIYGENQSLSCFYNPNL